MEDERPRYGECRFAFLGFIGTLHKLLGKKTRWTGTDYLGLVFRVYG